MKVVFYGTPKFAVNALDAIIRNGHEVVAVICQPDKLGNRKKIQVCEVKNYALNNGLNVYQFDKVSRDGLQVIRSFRADIGITCAYGQLLSQDVIDATRYGILNIHASLLPKYRGASPIQSALISGETNTGVTIMKTVLELDKGDILLKDELNIEPNETCDELSDRLSVLGAKLIIDALSMYEDSRSCRSFIKQNDEDATFCKKITKEMERIDWSQNASSVHNLIRGLSSNPSAYACLNGKILKITKSKVFDNLDKNEEYGKIVEASKDRIRVTCQVGSIELIEMQLEGGKRLTNKDFFNGRKICEGDILC